MSKVAIQGNPSGTGVLTIAAPNTNSDFTLTLPTSNGTLLDSTGGTTLTNLTVTNGASIQGLTVGRGAGAVASNTAVGASALAANTSGSGNVSVGYESSRFNTTGSFNVSLGRDSLYINTTGSSNTAIGYSALISNTTASDNAAVGYQAGYSNTTGINNTFVGSGAGFGNTTGLANAFFGRSAGALVTTGTRNTIIGGYNGNQGGLDIRTANNWIVLSDGDGSWAGRWVTGGSWVQSSNSSSWATLSDRRIKENIAPLQNALETIGQLNPVEYDYKTFDKRHEAGFIAQEYEAVLPDQITREGNISGEVAELTGGEPVLGIQQNLVPYLVKAIQELNAKVDAQAAEIAALKGQA